MPEMRSKKAEKVIVRQQELTIRTVIPPILNLSIPYFMLRIIDLSFYKKK